MIYLFESTNKIPNQFCMRCGNSKPSEIEHFYNFNLPICSPCNTFFKAEITEEIISFIIKIIFFLIAIVLIFILLFILEPLFPKYSTGNTTYIYIGSLVALVTLVIAVVHASVQQYFRKIFSPVIKYENYKEPIVIDKTKEFIKYGNYSAFEIPDDKLSHIHNLLQNNSDIKFFNDMNSAEKHIEKKLEKELPENYKVLIGSANWVLFVMIFPIFLFCLYVIFCDPEVYDLYSSSFSYDDFVKRSPKKSPHKLYQRIVNDGYNIKVMPSEYPVSMINEILYTPNTFDIMMSKNKDIILTSNIKKLEKETAENREKSKKELTKKEFKEIVKLNRLLLELLYPNETPQGYDLGGFIFFTSIITLFLFYLILRMHYKLYVNYETITMKNMIGMPIYSVNHTDITSYILKDAKYFIKTVNNKMIKVGALLDNQFEIIQAYTSKKYNNLT